MQDFGALAKQSGIRGVTSAKLTQDIEKLGALNDMKDILAARRGVGDIQAKAGVINAGMVQNMNKSAQIELDRENQKIKSYNDLAALSQTTATILFKIEELNLSEYCSHSIFYFIEKCNSLIFF